MKTVLLLTVFAGLVSAQALNQSVPINGGNATSQEIMDQRETLKTQEDQIQRAIDLLR